MDYKKSQATIYILIGAIVLFSAIAIFVFEQGGIEQPKIAEITEEIPTEMQPIKAFVEACIQNTGIEAVKLIGVHGGYIGTDVESTVYTGELFTFDDTGINPTNAEVLTVSEGWDIPYWWYLDSPNNAKNYVFATKKPFLEQGSKSIRNQINLYVSMNLDKCLNDFKSFEWKGMKITNTSGITTITTIAQNDVSIFVEFPLEVSYAGGIAKISQFKTNLDVNLKRMYDLASEIMYTEQIAHSFETHVLNVISVYSGMSESKLPPMAGTDFSFTSKRWQTSKVRKKLENLLAVYINVLQTTKTSGFEIPYFEGDSIKTGLYIGMIIPLEGDYAFIGDIDVSFNYLGWPIYLYITNGEVIKAKDTLSIPLVSLLIPIQRYDFPYDVSFPVMVSLHDPTAFHGRGYSFIYAMEGNIRNNEPLAVSYFEMEQERDTSASADQLCAPNQLNSEDVIISTIDPLYNPVSDVQVLFSVGDTGCGLGQTEIDESGQAVFRGKVPKGGIGSLVLIHPDYSTHVIFPFRGNDSVQHLDPIKLNKFVMKNVSAVKMNINMNPLNHKWGLIPVKRSFSNKEHAIIMLKKYKTTHYEEDVIAAANVMGSEMQEMRLTPGEYSLEITLIQDNSTIVIPRETICVEEDSDGDCEKEKDFGPTPIANDDPFVGGQYKINITLGNEIYFNNTLEFTTLNFNLKDYQYYSNHKDLERWSKSPQWHALQPDYKHYFRPKYNSIN